MSYLTSKNSRASRVVGGMIVILLGTLGCGQASHEANSSALVDEPVTTSAPPSFLDPEPTPPTSDTVVLSGGNMVLNETTPDTAIVLQRGVLLGWGKRGEVDMPNDSVGKDMRGKWVTPGTLTDLAHKTLPNLTALKIGEPANLLVFKSDPTTSVPTDQNLHGIVTEGELQIFATDADN